MRTIVILMLVFGICLPLSASISVTYYVSNDGSDSANGMSPSTPWRTIAHVNAETFQPGDTILFQRGGLWREELIISSSGTSISRITFGVYGTGAAPIINGSDLLSSWTATSVSEDGEVTTNGGGTQYIGTPATAANDLIGTSFRLEADVAAVSYNTSSEQDLIDKDICCSGSNRHYNFFLLNSSLVVNLFSATGTSVGYNVSVYPMLQAGVRYKLRADIIPDNGSGESAVTFSYSPDGVTYTQLGTTQSAASTVLNTANSVPVTVGRASNASPGLNGRIYRARAWTGLGTSLVYDMNVDDDTSGSATWASSTTGEIWTVNGRSVTVGPSTPAVYFTSVVTQPSQVFLDGNRLTSAANEASLGSGLWWYNSANKNIYIFDDPNAHVVEVSQRQYGIYGVGESYVTMNDMQVVQSGYRNMYCNGCNGLLVTGATFLNANDVGLEIDNGTGVVISNSTAAYSGSSGFGVYASAGIVLDHLVAHHNCALDAVNWTAGIKLNDTTLGTGNLSQNMTVQYSTSYSNGIGHPDYRGAGIWGDTVGDGFTVQHNMTYNNNIDGINIDGDNLSRVLFNTSYSNGVPGSASGMGIILLADGSDTMNGHLVYGNTVWGNLFGGVQVLGHAGGYPNGCTSNIVKNNLSTANVGPNLAVANGCENGAYGSGNVYSYNGFGLAANNFIEWGLAIHKSTYSEWETAAGGCGTNGCTHSVQADPMFASPSTADFSLKETSPARNAGLGIPGYSFSYGAPDLGAIPYYAKSANTLSF